MIIGATTDGKKVLLACEGGERESKQSMGGIYPRPDATGFEVANVDGR